MNVRGRWMCGEPGQRNLETDGLIAKRDKKGRCFCLREHHLTALMRERYPAMGESPVLWIGMYLTVAHSLQRNHVLPVSYAVHFLLMSCCDMRVGGDPCRPPGPQSSRSTASTLCDEDQSVDNSM